MKMVFREACFVRQTERGGIIHRSIDHRQTDSRCDEVEEFGEVRRLTGRPFSLPFLSSVSDSG